MQPDSAPLPWTFHVAAALSLSLGWGIRGNYGHEYGAMIPGALAALAVCLMSGRPDWHRRAAEFAWLGALGWSFGGSISYMQVVAYTHSGHSPSVLYGFACLFVIGFLWAALGGAGTALAAVAPRRFLSDLLLPMSLVFALWWLQGVAIEPWLRSRGYELVLVRYGLAGGAAGDRRRAAGPGDPPPARRGHRAGAEHGRRAGGPASASWSSAWTCT